RGQRHADAVRAARAVRRRLFPQRGQRGGRHHRPRRRLGTLRLGPAMYSRAVTVAQFCEQEERKHPEATGEFTSVLMDIALASKMINREVVRAGLVDILGYTGGQNVHGEKVQKLDQFAHQTITRVLGSTGQLAVLASEEDENVIQVPEGAPVGKYVV